MIRMKTGLVGCGNIATDLALAIEKGDIPAEIVALTDIDDTRARRFQQQCAPAAEICGLEENAERADFVVECAVAEAVKPVAEACARHHTGCLIMSVSGLARHPELLEAHHRLMRVPSGAICGLDGIRAAMEAGLDSVTLTTRKPPRGLEGAPFLVEHDICVDNLSAEKVVFEGNALEAARAFPKNVNVASALSIAGIGPEHTRVRIIADPAATENSHEIRAEGAFGKLLTVMTNRPSPRNPKSSYMASLSAVAELRMAAEDFLAARGG
jgi:aspartate dehydrogenase